MIKITKESKQITIIDLVEEYQDENADIKWAVVTDLKEQELQLIFGDEIQSYSPYSILSLEQGQAIFDFHKNNAKFDWRYRHKEICGLTEEVMTIISEDVHSFDGTKNVNSRIIRNEALLHALDSLTEKQKSRFIMHVIDELTEREIGDLENADHKSVHESIAAARRKLRKRPELEGLLNN